QLYLPSQMSLARSTGQDLTLSHRAATHRNATERRRQRLLFLVEGHAVDRLSLAVRALRRRGACLAVGGHDDGLHDRLLAGELGNDPDGVLVDARDGEGIPEWRRTRGRVVLAVVLGGE